jgi:precorrin-2 dehydrogenase/sirohydrochlorin ferrochelatase
VFAATDNRELNARISLDARKAGALVNVVDDPELCNFIVPAVARSGALQIAVSTDGKSPSFARRVRNEVARSIDPAYRGYVDFIGELRQEILQLDCLSKEDKLRKLRLLADEQVFKAYKKSGKRAARRTAMKLIGL